MNTEEIEVIIIPCIISKSISLEEHTDANGIKIIDELCKKYNRELKIYVKTKYDNSIVPYRDKIKYYKSRGIKIFIKVFYYNQTEGRSIERTGLYISIQTLLEQQQITTQGFSKDITNRSTYTFEEQIATIKMLLEV